MSPEAAAASLRLGGDQPTGGFQVSGTGSLGAAPTAGSRQAVALRRGPSASARCPVSPKRPRLFRDVCILRCDEKVVRPTSNGEATAE